MKRLTTMAVGAVVVALSRLSGPRRAPKDTRDFRQDRTCGRTGASFDATCDSKGKLAAGELGVTR